MVKKENFITDIQISTRPASKNTGQKLDNSNLCTLIGLEDDLTNVFIYFLFVSLFRYTTAAVYPAKSSSHSWCRNPCQCWFYRH